MPEESPLREGRLSPRFVTSFTPGELRKSGKALSVIWNAGQIRCIRGEWDGDVVDTGEIAWLDGQKTYIDGDTFEQLERELTGMEGF